MLIHLSDILLTVGKEYVMEVPLEQDSITWQGNTYPVLEKSLFIFKIRNESNQIFYVKAEGKLTLNLICDRCLEDVPTEFPISFVADVDVKRLTEDSEDSVDEQAYMEKDWLDTNKLILQELLLHMPMKVLCDENCKGICNRCGANLNRGTCNCKEEPKDMRMAAILDIFKANTEE